MTAPTVFISYSHDSEEHDDRVLTLADQLRSEGVDCTFDQYVDSPPEGWPNWMDRQIENADFVLVVCTETYCRRASGTEEEGTGLGARWESTLTHQHIYNAGSKNSRFVPVLLRPEDGKHIPTPLQGATHYCVATQQGYENLYGRLTSQPTRVKPELGKLRELPVRQRSQDFLTSEPPKAPRLSLARLPSTSPDLFGREKGLAILDAAWESPQTNIVSIVAWGGVGKTALVNKWLLGMGADSYRGAERVFGWSFYSQGAAEDRQVSADQFIASALEWFGDLDPTEGSPWAKGERLAELISNQRTLLVLDGLEPLQYPPGEMGGRLKDPGLQSLLRELARYNPGLSILTTRVTVDDIKEFVDTRVQGIDLDDLSPEAGAQLLDRLGIKGSPEELKQASSEFGGHALALTLLGTYLAVAYGGDIRQRDRIPRVMDEQKQGAHARRVMLSYEEWFKGKPEIDILNLMGMFDRPAEGGAVEALRAKPAVKGLTGKLQKLSDAEWHYAIHNLRTARLLLEPDKSASDTLDCHPLVREHFGERLRETAPAAWKEAHSRLYEYYKSAAKEHPDNLEEMAPLFAAVAHGCQAGRHQEALDDVYWSRIQRGGTFYASQRLGSGGALLGAMLGFFEAPWERPVAALNGSSASFMLGEAGFYLRSLGRTEEAACAMRAGLASRIGGADWLNAAKISNNLAELHMVLGDLGEAVDFANQGVDYADRSGAQAQRMIGLTTLAWVLHQRGRVEEAGNNFREAERIERERNPGASYLYSIRGFQYCEFLLDEGEYEQVLARAANTIQVATRNGWLLDIALDELSLGRACLMQGVGEGPDDFTKAGEHLEAAVAGLRKAGEQFFLPLGLLNRAALYRVQDDFPKAQGDLDEAHLIATRSGMRLYEAGCHLEYAGLYVAMGDLDKGRVSLDKAREMIDDMGYHRRDKEVKDLEKQLMPKKR